MVKRTPGMDTMEEEVGSMRRSVGEKAEHLRERMSSSDLMESSLEFARSNGGAIASGVGRTVREHPVPTARIGAGLACDRKRVGHGKGRSVRVDLGRRRNVEQKK